MTMRGNTLPGGRHTGRSLANPHHQRPAHRALQHVKPSPTYPGTSIVSGGVDPRYFGGATRFYGKGAFFSGDHEVLRTADRRDRYPGRAGARQAVDNSDV